MFGHPCLCDHRADIRCDETHCDIAGPGAPQDANQCRVCWNRLGRPAVRGPRLLRRIWNYAKAVYWHRRFGKRMVTEAVARRRLDVCEACDHFDCEKRRCSRPECGCNMDVKVTWAEQKCPLRKWKEEL
jgi:hypothetical protein